MSNLIVQILEPEAAIQRMLTELLAVAGHQTEIYRSGEVLLEQVRPNRKAILFVSLNLPQESALALLPRIFLVNPATSIIAICNQGDVSSAVKAIKAGAATLVEKPLNPDGVLEALDEAKQHLTEQRHVESKRQMVRRLVGALSEKEREVLARLVEGMPNKQIAKRLDIGLRTVELRRSNIMKKFGVKSLAEAVKIATLYELDDDDNNIGAGVSTH